MNAGQIGGHAFIDLACAEITAENLSETRGFQKIDLDETLVFLLTEQLHNESFADLTCAFDQQAFFFLGCFPVQQVLVYFSFQHEITSGMVLLHSV